MHSNLTSKLLAIVCLALIGPSVLQAELTEAEVGETVLNLHSKLQENRNKYQNVHFTYQFELERFDNFTQKKTVEYWAREGVFYRFDEETSVLDEPPVKTSFILTPQGYQTYRFEEGNFALLHSGPASEGLTMLQLQEFYDAANRCYRFFDAEMPLGKQVGVELTTPLSKANSQLFTPKSWLIDDKKLSVLTTFKTIKEGKSNESVYLSEYNLERGVHINYLLAPESSGGTNGSFNCTKEYDFEAFGVIPKSIRIAEVFPGGQWSNTSWTLQNLDWATPGTDVFKIGAFNNGADGMNQQESNFNLLTAVAMGIVLGILAITIYWITRPSGQAKD